MAFGFNEEDDVEDINGDLELRMGKEKELCEKQLEKAKLAFKNCIDKGDIFSCYYILLRLMQITSFFIINILLLQKSETRSLQGETSILMKA